MADEERKDIREEIKEEIEEKTGEKKRKSILKIAGLVIGGAIAVALLMIAFPEFYDTMLEIHKSLAKDRYSVYGLVGAILFVEFMRKTWIESAKARSKRLIPLTSPETEIWVREKPLIGIKLPFGKEIKSKRIRPHIIETELGWIVYPNKSLLSPQWNGEVYFIPADSIHGHGNVRVISAIKPHKPTRIEIMENGEEVPIYEWEPIDLGHEKYMKSMKELQYLQTKLRITEEYAEAGWQHAKKLSTIPQELYAKLKQEGYDDALRLLEKLFGKGFLTEVARAEKERIKAVIDAIKKEEEV